jgi:hypothetical protein
MQSPLYLFKGTQRAVRNVGERDEPMLPSIAGDLVAIYCYRRYDTQQDEEVIDAQSNSTVDEAMANN